MENKGLNIFNTKYVLANQATATDVDFSNIESVVGHEYFHNWSGDRVTCRDWFQLSLKEGLTVFRDQEFSQDLCADASARAVKRIEDVRVLRTAQFPEDAGPMVLAHLGRRLLCLTSTSLRCASMSRREARRSFKCKNRSARSALRCGEQTAHQANFFHIGKPKICIADDSTRRVGQPSQSSDS